MKQNLSARFPGFYHGLSRFMYNDETRTVESPVKVKACLAMNGRYRHGMAFECAANLTRGSLTCVGDALLHIYVMNSVGRHDGRALRQILVKSFTFKISPFSFLCQNRKPSPDLVLSLPLFFQFAAVFAGRGQQEMWEVTLLR